MTSLKECGTQTRAKELLVEVVRKNDVEMLQVFLHHGVVPVYDRNDHEVPDNFWRGRWLHLSSGLEQKDQVPVVLVQSWAENPASLSQFEDW